MAVVAQHAQVVVRNLRVGAVQVDRVHRAAGHRAVRQRVIQPADLRLRQGIGAAQTRPAIAAVHELVGEAEAQRRVRAQVGDAFDAQLRRLVPAHADRVGVVEAQRVGDADAQWFQPDAQGGDVGVGGHVMQQFVAQRAGVLRVGVDVALAQGLPQDAGAAEFALVHGRHAGVARGQARDLAQDHRLGELLGADPRRLRDRQRGPQARQQHEGEAGMCGGHGAVGRVRCACTNRRTKSSAGRSRRSA